MQVQIITKDNCPFCVKAKTLLSIKQIPYTELRLGKDISRDQIVEQFPIMKTVPIITIDGRLIGGFQQLNQLNEQGQLDGVVNTEWVNDHE